MNLTEQMELFVTRADQLAEMPLLQSGGLNTSFSLNWREGALTTSSVEPDEHMLRSALMLIRQFVSANELVFLDRIYSLCERHLKSDDLKEKLRFARQAWKKSKKESWLNMTHNGHTVTPTYVADLWINGHYFHADYAKEAALKSLVGEEEVFMRHLFLGYVSEVVNQVLYLRNVIRYALREDLLDQG